MKIILPKFKGYESELDMHNFQGEFLKIHQRSTPKGMMDDVLKNNFLDGPALSLVNSITDVDKIWERLKRSYEDDLCQETKKQEAIARKKCHPIYITRRQCV